MQGPSLKFGIIDPKVVDPEYSKDIFAVLIVGAAALGSRQTEQGSLLQNGHYSPRLSPTF